MHTRRDFLKTSAASTAALSISRLCPAQPEIGQLPVQLVPSDKGISAETLASWKARGTRRVYRGPNLYAIGMPIGGICAGQLYLLGDGTLGGWHIDGEVNPTGYGSANYNTRRADRELVQGFSLAGGSSREKTRTRALSEQDDNAIEFIGEYPIAEVRYPPSTDQPRDPGRGLIERLDVRMRAYSPFCPLSAKDSALPCTMFRFQIHNPTDQAFGARLTARLENGVELTQLGEIQPQRRNRVMNENGLTAVLMDAIPTQPRKDPRPERLIADFEAETFIGWKREGEAFSQGPSKGTRPNQNEVTGFQGKQFANSFTAAESTVAGDKPIGRLTSEPFTIDRDFLTFLIGGGNHKNRTCMNLLVENKVVRTATGRADEKLDPFAWDVREFTGKQAELQIVDSQSGPWGHINVDQIALTDTLPESLRRPNPDSLRNGTMCLAFLGNGEAKTEPLLPGSNRDTSISQTSDDRGPIGHISAPFSLAPGESIELVFVISWHFPNLHTGAGDSPRPGRMYTNWFTDALEVARYVRDNDKRLHEQTELFRKTYYDDTTLPWWLALRLMMPTSTLATGTAHWWKNGRFWGWEGVGCCHGTCTHVWNYSHAEARLFPELARSTRTMQDLASGFDEKTGRVAFRGEVKGGFDYAADGQCGTVLKMYREHLCSSDGSFLKANWPRIQKVLEFLIAKDAELDPSGKADGIIEGVQHNTYDINFVGANTFVGSLYLAALKAGAEMAMTMGEKDAAQRYLDLAGRGRQYTETKLFNGEYFIQKIPPDQVKAQWQYGDGCLSDQLFGQNWARCLDLGTLYDEAKVKAALQAVYRHNWAPPGGSLQQYNSVHPPERWFARERDGGLFVCTWPRGSRPGEPVRYRDEVWTGCEYQAAAGMMWEGMVDEALAIVQAVDDRYDGALHNPWNEVECGDHYSRALAAWGVYQAVCGFHYDGPRGVIGMDPRLNAADFAAFFSGAEGWGLMKQKREKGEQKNSFEVRWGTLRVSEVRARLEGMKKPRVEVRVNGTGIAARVEERGELTSAVFEPVTVEAGGAVECVWQT